MKPREFFDLVVKMRECQKVYFKTRYSADLNKSKRIEKLVDAEIKRVQEIEEKRRSPELF